MTERLTLTHAVGLTSLAVALSLAGCPGDPEGETGLVVVVDTDLSIPAELDAIRVAVTAPSGTVRTVDERVESRAVLPLRVDVEPEGSRLGPFRIVASGLAGGTVVVQQEVETSLIRGQLLMLEMMLAGTCVGVGCDGETTCAAGLCREVRVPPETLPPWPRPMDGGATGTIEIGTGCVGEFVPFEDGEQLSLVRGPQGGQHVQTSLRVAGIDLQPALVSMRVERVRDGEIVSIPLQVRLRFEIVEGESYEELTGLNLVIPVPDEALGEDLIMRVRVQENSPDGAFVEGMRPIRVDWADPPCGPTFRRDGGPLDPDGGADAGADAGVPDAAPPADA